MTHVPPCPFCGAPVVPLVANGSDRVITYRLDCAPGCYLYDKAVRAVPPAFIPSWSRRATVVGAPVCYEVVDGVPVFNEFGQGTRADPAFINKCFDFLLTFWKNNQK